MKYQLVGARCVGIPHFHVEVEQQVGAQRNDSRYQMCVDVDGLIVKKAPALEAVRDVGCDWAVPPTNKGVVGVPCRQLMNVVQPPDGGLGWRAVTMIL